ncbi:hypothetical protein E1B28_011937 [Marasmius oreades]|uniref:NADP-dependent oxidoreductase domain-containing protein n=1 Tax=Marasmius oreades TaxID=181124 RepID=A0A9P7UNF1_9AGAR|nr:uncharacterized protein E1B28_011937 [Marasmius oreades]KAG7087890.1 hypothetical protein E1B28_011937 [Marasmius oreades]
MLGVWGNAVCCLWSVKDRDLEWEIIPLVRSFGIAIAPWGVLCQGKLLSDIKRRQESGEGHSGIIKSDTWHQTEDEIRISRTLETVAKEIGAKSVTAVLTVGIAYVMQKTSYVFPVVGRRKVEHLVENLEALDIKLSDENINYLEVSSRSTPDSRILSL